MPTAEFRHGELRRGSLQKETDLLFIFRFSQREQYQCAARDGCVVRLVEDAGRSEDLFFVANNPREPASVGALDRHCGTVGGRRSHAG